MTAVSVDIRSKTFAAGTPQAFQAIGRLTFEVNANELVAILGPSGCGKTTLLQLAAGLDDDYDGTVRFGEGLRERLAYVFQTPRLLPWRTVRQNIELALPAGTAEAEARIGRTLRDVGLAGFAASYPGQLSLGMQRRAALARAFVLEPRLLLMDEPFVSLDAGLAERLRALLRSLLASHPATVLFVTHDQREAIMLADRLILLSPGPARKLAELTVDLAADERQDERAVEAFRQRHAALFSETGERANIAQDGDDP